AIAWSYFNQNACFDARLINFSQNGVYFQTDRELKPGVSIFLNMKKISSGMIEANDHQRPRSVSLGEVQWCIDLSGRNRSCFGVGVRFPFPY
ncbi:MAG: PilZ domain-containing protein, partial [Deltaproteobacteria bacterium]|nr:PilZ domain-containing protein [Deltaproteobacteria bacterium]